METDDPPERKKSDIDPPEVKQGDELPQEDPKTRIEVLEPHPATPKAKVNFTRIAKSTRSWTLNLIVIFLLVVLFKIILLEIYDRGYHIQALRVPQEFEINGYDGVTAAYMILDDVNRMISIGNRDRSTKDVEDYQQSAGRTQLQVEVGGVGISPETISSYIKQALGIKSRSVDGEIVRHGDGLKFFLRISGRPTETLTQRIDSAGATVAFEKIIQQGAELVLKSNYPLILGTYYLTTGNEKAIETFRYTTHSQPDQAATAYASMATSLSLSVDRDTSRMLNLIRKALALDPKNATAYVVWGIIEDQRGNGEKGLALFRKSVQLDPTNINTWATLGYKFLLVGGNDEEAISCFEKCFSLDSTYSPSLDYWTTLLFIQGKFEEAKEKLEKLKYLDPNQGTIMSIAIPIALGDTAWAMRDFKRAKEKDKINVGELMGELNALAEYHKSRKQYETGVRLIQFALRLDSTSVHATFPYATLAELCGLKGDRGRFYSYFEKSLRLGFKPSQKSFVQIEPYKTFSPEDRYKKLLAKYGIK